MNNAMTLGMDAMAFSLQLMTGVLAQDEPRQTGPDFGKASPLGLIVLVLLLIGTFALVWSMNRHLRRLPKSFDTQNSGEPDSANEHRVDGTSELPPGPPVTSVDSDTAEPPPDGTPRGLG